MFNAIPTFWGNAELGKIVHLYLDHCSFSTDTDDISAFIKSIAKKASPAVLLPALSELWSSLQGAKVKVSIHQDELEAVSLIAFFRTWHLAAKAFCIR